MFGRILVGLDADGAGHRAAIAAQRLQQCFDCEVRFVQAISALPLAFSAPAMAAWAANRDRALAASRTLATERLRAEFRLHAFDTSGLDHAVEVVEGTPAAVLAHAADRPTDLIMLGPHRHHGALELGSTARSVLAKSHVPVWIQPQDGIAIRRVICGVDLSPHTQAVLSTAQSLARSFDAALLVVHAFEAPSLAMGVEPFYAVEQIRNDAERAFAGFAAAARAGYDGPFEAEFADGEPSAALLARASTGDVLVVGTHGHSALLRAVLGSTAYRVAKRSTQPVLVVPQRDRAA